jgi:hypothetical protein
MLVSYVESTVEATGVYGGRFGIPGRWRGRDIPVPMIGQLNDQSEIRFLTPISEHVLDRLVERNLRFPAGGQF